MQTKANIKKRDLRIFSFALTVILSLFSVKFCKAMNLQVGGALLAMALATFFIGLFLPILILPVYKILSFIGKIIGHIVTALLLGVIFYCVFTPISVILRLTKKDILRLRFEKNKTSYWISRKNRTSKRENLERQY